MAQQSQDEGQEQGQKKHVPNFSRPRQLLSKLNPSDSSSPTTEEREQLRQHESRIHHLTAFNTTPPLPNEPRFSTDSNPSSNQTPPSTSSSQQKPLLKSILKSTTISQHSSRASSEIGGEDTRSHHTVSENGYEVDGKWSSSEADTSELSEREIEKLEKKGINPALYVEMQKAKGGGGGLGVGRLTGNAYV